MEERPAWEEGWTRFSLVLTNGQYAWLRMHAIVTEQSMGCIVRDLLDAAMDRPYSEIAPDVEVLRSAIRERMEDDAAQ